MVPNSIREAVMPGPVPAAGSPAQSSWIVLVETDDKQASKQAHSFRLSSVG